MAFMALSLLVCTGIWAATDVSINLATDPWNCYGGTSLNSTYNITYTGRTFEANTWEILCLPFDANSSQIDNAFEVAEHVTLEGIRQSERKKVDILGQYLGRTFYKQDANWQDMHQMITMAGSLTLRQLIVIRLIADKFEGLDTSMFIGNPSACVEINNLLNYGIWQTKGASFGTNNSLAIQLSSIIPTSYSKQVKDVLMLDRLPKEDIERTIESFHLTSEGSIERVLTEEDYKRDISNSSKITFRDWR